MPVIFRHKGYRFFFFSNEGIPLEPCHIHVKKGSAVAKFWIMTASTTCAKRMGCHRWNYGDYYML